VPDQILEIVALERVTAGQDDDRRPHLGHVIQKSGALVERQLIRMTPVDRLGPAVATGERAGPRDLPDQQERGLVEVDRSHHEALRPYRKCKQRAKALTGFRRCPRSLEAGPRLAVRGVRREVPR
jgi:hypothetical protein